jgi:hypothetical protein
MASRGRFPLVKYFILTVLYEYFGMGFFTNRLIQKKQMIDAEIAVYRQ